MTIPKMMQAMSLLLAFLPLALSATAPASTPDAASLKPIEISELKFDSSSVAFTFDDPNTQVKTTCSATTIPTTYVACNHTHVAFKFASGDSASDFHISLLETYTGQFALVATKEVTQSPPKFNVSIKTVYPVDPFSLPEILTISPSGRPGDSPYATLNLTVTGEPGTKCTTQWMSSERPPEGDIPCADPSFAFRVTEFKGVGQFTLALSKKRTVKTGAEVGNTMKKSGSVTVNNQTPDPNYHCTGSSGVESCGIANGKAPLEAPILGLGIRSGGASSEKEN
ncbi:MAG: hypothetical protein Q9210_000781 [Variospora velana]